MNQTKHKNYQEYQKALQESPVRAPKISIFCNWRGKKFKKKRKDRERDRNLGNPLDLAIAQLIGAIQQQRRGRRYADSDLGSGFGFGDLVIGKGEEESGRAGSPRNRIWRRFFVLLHHPYDVPRCNLCSAVDFLGGKFYPLTAFYWCYSARNFYLKCY